MEKTLLSQATFLQFREFIEKSCGIVIGDEKAYLVESRLVGLLAASESQTFDELYQKVAMNRLPGLRDKVLDAMTTNETLWFRDGYPFEYLEKVYLPPIIAEIKKNPAKKLRIWCAACSSGQEPYSIAIILQELARTMGHTNLLGTIEIVATDISPTILFLATSGRYSSIAMARGLPDALKSRYFAQSGTVWVLREDVRRMVQFKKLNLQDSFAFLGKFDLIFCRNVLIYFSDTFKRDLFARFTKVLYPEATLFLGASEMATSYSSAFELQRYNGRSMYRLKKE